MNVYASIRARAGALLVAHPTMDDPNFERTVVLLLVHDDDAGTMGVVLNRPARARGRGPEHGVLAPWLESSQPPEQIFEGGPVEEDGFICLAQDDGADSGVRSIDILGEDPVEDRRHRIFRGHAGWAPGQLDSEIAGGYWAVVPSRQDDAFDGSPDTLWRRVLEREGGDHARLARVPVDPGLN